MTASEDWAVRFNPLADNPLLSRDDVARAARDLIDPLCAHRSPGKARVRLSPAAAAHTAVGAELEGFARPLWALASMAAGGIPYDGWDAITDGLISGADPGHPEFWGWPTDHDQRLVEMAAIGYALALAPDRVWYSLTTAQRFRLEAWLLQINARNPHDNNWLFFRVIVNLGLKRVSARFDAALVEAALVRLESFYVGDGWYRDGPTDRLDYYNAFGMQMYGLLYAQLESDADPARAQRFKDRAARFAQDFQAWFGYDGAAVPFGRSMTYRFAQGAFWGALACADVEALPWPVIKGLFLRHLRWWSRQPIAERDGVLSIGYAYPNLFVSEEYNSPGSPYWAMKAFVPLALPAKHPFWSCDEDDGRDLPRAISVQPHARMAIVRDETHAVALCGGQDATLARGAAAKYAKFAYSSRFAFSVPSDGRVLAKGAFDSVLALSEDGERWQPRARSQDHAITEDGVVYSAWTPIPGVLVRTWLAHLGGWHVRVHAIESDRRLFSAEGGFALDRTDRDQVDEAITDAASAFATSPAGFLGIRDVSLQRTGEIVRASPNTNLIAPRTVIPTLRGEHPPGSFVLRTLVLAAANVEIGRAAWAIPPELPASMANVTGT